MHAEVGFSGHEQGVVLRGLDVELTGPQHLPRDQGLEDGIRHGDVLPHATTAVEEVHARRGHDALVKVGAATVVPDIIGTEIELRDPEDLGPCQFRLGHPHAGLRGRHDQGPARRRVVRPWRD